MKIYIKSLTLCALILLVISSAHGADNNNMFLLLLAIAGSLLSLLDFEGELI